MKVSFNNIMNWSLIILAILCLFLIVIIGLEVKSFWTEIDDSNLAENVNEVLLNLSYSYITGFLVFFLTVLLPHLNKQKKIKPAIDDKLRAIKDKLENSVKCIYPVEDRNNLSLSKESFVNKFITTQIADKFKVRTRVTALDVTIFDYLNKERKDINGVISELIEYREYLSSNSLLFLESIRNSNYFSFLRVLENYSELPKEIVNNKRLLGEFLYDLYEAVKDKELFLD